MIGTTAKVLADSITDGGSRLTTWELRYRRSQHAAVMTYRSCARNGASSRAIPPTRKRELMLADLAYPAEWGRNQRGMRADAVLEGDAADAARAWFERGAAAAAAHHEEGERLGLHKQVVNRYIEPYEHMTVILTACQDFHANMLHQRLHADADPAFQELARAVDAAYLESLPTYVAPGGWHLPLVWAEDLREIGNAGPTTWMVEDIAVKVSVGRCARVSYLTHDGRRDWRDDVALYEKLLGTVDGADPGHFSPFEHACRAVGGRRRVGPFEGWRSHRSMLAGEAGPDTTVDRCERCGMWGRRHVARCPLAPPR